MIIVRKEGKVLELKLKPFDNEEELRKQLLTNLNIIPVRDLGEDDQRISAWQLEFPLKVGSIDIAAVGDGGGLYLIETKLFKNQDKRKVIAQALDYAAGIWNEYGQNSEEFLRILQQKSEGYIPEDENFLDHIKQNLRDAKYYILIAMDNVTQQVKDLIEFLNKKTNFKVLALELEHHVGDDQIEIILPRTYGEEINREIVTTNSSPIWYSEQLKIAFDEISDLKLKNRLQIMREFGLKENLFMESKGKVPQFSLKSKLGRLFGVTAEGNMYAYIGKTEQAKYPSEKNRYDFVNDLKTLKLLPQNQNPDEVKSGRNLIKKLGQLNEEEFEKLLDILRRHLKDSSY